MTRPSDMVLVAYVDGELDAGQARDVEAALSGDRDARARARVFRDTRALLRRALDEAGPLPMPARLSNLIRRPTTRLGGSRLTTRRLAAASILVVVAGMAYGSATYFAHRQFELAQANDWLEEVAEYHSVFAKEDLHIVEVRAEAKDYLESWLGARLGTTLRVPDLAAHGLEFLGGRMIVIKSVPAALFSYASPKGPPVALCVSRSLPDDRRPTHERVETLNAVYWVDSGYTYTLLGWVDPDFLGILAEEVERQRKG